jgi:hypothetical protein
MKAGKASPNRVHVVENLKAPTNPPQHLSPQLAPKPPSRWFPPSDHGPTIPMRPQHFQEVWEFVSRLEHYGHISGIILQQETAKFLKALEKYPPLSQPGYQPLPVTNSSNANPPPYSDRQTLISSASSPTELQAPFGNTSQFVPGFPLFPPLYPPPGPYG